MDHKPSSFEHRARVCTVPRLLPVVHVDPDSKQYTLFQALAMAPLHAACRYGRFQSMLNVSAHQLLANTSPVQGTMLLLAGPFVDRLVTGHWIHNWEVNVPGMEVGGLGQPGGWGWRWGGLALYI